MKRFLLKISIYLFLLLVFALSAEYLITKRVNQGFRYSFQADWHDLKNHNSEILFIGNSRIWVHVDPFAIQEKFRTKCEIIGINGQGPHLLWLKFKEYSQHNIPPKEIYLQFDPFFLQQRQDLYGIQNFSTGFFRDRIDLSSLKPYKGYSDFYRFAPLSAIDFTLLIKVILNDTVSKSDSYESTHGFQRQDKKWNGNWSSTAKTIIDTNNISSYIDSFIVYSKKKNINLYAIYPPQSPVSYRNTLKPDMLLFKISGLSELFQYPVTFIDFNSDSLYSDSTLFYNHMHLNSKGVGVFMKQLINEKEAFRRFR